MGITEESILATLEVKGVEDIGLDELAKLKAMANSLKEGDQTPEELFVMPEKVTPGKGMSGLKDKLKAKEAPAAEAPPAQALHDEAKKILEKVLSEKPPEKAPPSEKKAPEDAPQSTISKPADAVPVIVSTIAAILRGAKNLTELDQAWKREVEGGALEKVDKKRLAYVYAAVRDTLTKGEE